MSSPTIYAEPVLAADQSARFSMAKMAKFSVLGVVSLALLYAVWSLYLAGEPLFAVLVMAVLVGVVLIYGNRRFYTARFVFPAVVTVGLFIAFPVIYTSYVGFTNYSASNLLSFHRVNEIHLSRVTVDKRSERPFFLLPAEGGYRLVLRNADGDLISSPFFADGTPLQLPMQPAYDVEALAGEFLAPRDMVRLRGELGAVTALLPDGQRLTTSGIRTMADVQPVFEELEDGRLRNRLDGDMLVADHSVGFYRDEAGNQVAPGWRVNVGLDNFKRILFSEGIRGPMLEIFIWTVTFALLSVLCTFGVGVLLAVILQWEHLRFRGLYRILLILPYAVPGFISILVFRGLFNQNFGEINLILEAVFGIRPEWFTDPTLARAMTVIVNTWLGYPYMMLLAMGYLQSVPGDHARAAALEGASPVRTFFSITLPQILPPFAPMLISAFAFNFNNLVLILLLTRGLPDIPGTLIPAGSTDLLASFTYRISFMDSGQNFGLAGAIATLIFVIVGAMAYANFVALRRAVTARGK
ncbi:maltose ABC transporter permease MalF [Zobellella endophytica]|nr:maltose ABC transporter permease MalF [Zobellella endophytica]